MRRPKDLGYKPIPANGWEKKIEANWGTDFSSVHGAVIGWIAAVVNDNSKRLAFGERWRAVLGQGAERILQNCSDRNVGAFSVNMELRQLLARPGFSV